MPAVVKKNFLYADDSAKLVSGKNINNIKQDLSNDLQNVNN